MVACLMANPSGIGRWRTTGISPALELLTLGKVKEQISPCFLNLGLSPLLPVLLGNNPFVSLLSTCHQVPQKDN